MTAVGHFESVHRFKTLQLGVGMVANRAKRQVAGAGSHAESFPLRETELDVFLRSFAAPTVLETSAD